MNKFIFEKNMADVEPMEIDDETPVAPKKKRIKLTPYQKRKADRKKRAIKNIEKGKKSRKKAYDIMKKADAKYAEAENKSRGAFKDGFWTSAKGWGQRALSLVYENNTQTLEERKNMSSKKYKAGKTQFSENVSAWYPPKDSTEPEITPSDKDRSTSTNFKRRLGNGKLGPKIANLEEYFEPADTTPIVDAIMNAEPATTQDMIKDILSNKLAVALDAYKSELSNDVFNEPSEFDDEDYEDGLELTEEGPEDEDEFEDDEEEFDDSIFDDEEYVEDEGQELEEEKSPLIRKAINLITNRGPHSVNQDDLKPVGKSLNRWAIKSKK